MNAPSGRPAPPAAPAPVAREVTSAGMSTTTQCQKPDTIGASGSKQVTTKDLVSGGNPDQESWGEVLPPEATCASASGEPSTTSLLVTVKEGTWGSSAYGSGVTGRSSDMISPLRSSSSGADSSGQRATPGCRVQPMTRPVAAPRVAGSRHGAGCFTGAWPSCEPVSAADDPRLDDYRHLRDVELRKSVEAEHGLFLAEGEKVVRRAVEAGYEPRSFLMAERWLDGLADVLDRTDAPCFVVTEALAEEVTGFHVHRGALASLRRRPLPALEDVVAGASTVVVLEDIVDHTNVGAVLRSCAALGVDAVLLSPRCADPLYRRAVKVAMGAVFSIPWTRLEGWYDAMETLRSHGFTTVALTPAPDSVDLAEAVEHPKVALVAGSEGRGLSGRWLGSADVRAVIPMRRGVDSLNVAAASAIACYVAMGRSSWGETGQSAG